jgi:hypothetical protein
MKKNNLMQYFDKHPLIILSLITALFFSVVLNFYRDPRDGWDICLEGGGVWSFDEARCFAPFDLSRPAIGPPQFRLFHSGT